MSQASVAAPVARSATARTGDRVRTGDRGQRRVPADRGRDAADRYGSPSPSPLRVVRGGALTRSSTGFAVCCVTVLGLGLVALLLLNTTLSQRAFTLHALQRTSGQLADTQDALTQSLARTSSPARLAARASALGMVPAQSTAFLRLSDGAVLGVAKPAQPQLGFSVVTAPTQGKPPTTGGFATAGSAQRESASAHLPTTTSTRVSTKGATTTTTTTTTVTDASHNTVRTTIRAVAVTGSDSGGTQSTQQRITTTARTVKTTDKGTTTTTRVTRPDGSSSTTTVTVSGVAGVAGAPAAPAPTLALR